MVDEKTKALVEVPKPQETHDLIRKGDLDKLKEIFETLPAEERPGMIERHVFHAGAEFGFQNSSQWLRIWEDILIHLDKEHRREVLKNLSDTVIALLIDSKAGEYCAFLADIESERVQNILDSIPSIWKEHKLNPDNLINVLYTMLEEGAEISNAFISAVDINILAYPLAQKFSDKNIDVMDMNDVIIEEERQNDPHLVFLERLKRGELTPEQLGIEDEEINIVYRAIFTVNPDIFHEIIFTALTVPLSQLEDIVMEQYQFRQEERLGTADESGDDWSDYGD